MQGLNELGEVISLLYERAYLPDQSDREAFAVLPGKRGGGDPRQIEVRDGKAANLLDRLSRELTFMSNRYLDLLTEEDR